MLFSVHPTLVFNFLYQLDEGLAVDVFGWDSRTGYPARFWGTMSFVDKTDESNWVTRTSIFTMTSGALPPTCGSFSIEASSAAVGYAASSQVVTISGMPDGCTSGDWQASSNAPWLRVSAQSGSGPGAVTVSWTQNWTSTSRSAVVTIAGNSFIVAQDPFPAPPVSDPNSDFDNDGWTDLVFRHRTTGEMVAWLMAGPTMVNFKMLDPVSASTNWRLAGTGDLDGDRKPDLLWQEERSGLLYVWLMDGTTRKSHSYLSILGPADAGWKVVSVADMNGDGKPDLVWQHAVFGALAAWYLDGLTVTGRVSLDPWTVRDTRWHVVATGDFDRDGKTDLLWKHATEGYLVAWLMNGVTLRSVEWLAPGQLADVGWEIVATGDFNADGRLDIIFQHSSSGYMVAWFMDGLVQSGWLMLTPDRVQDPGWGIAAHR